MGKAPLAWVVERALSWFNHSRRLSKDYGISISSAEAMVTGACISEHALEHAMSAYHPNLPHGAGLIMIPLAYYQHFVDAGCCPDRFTRMAQALGMKDASKPQDFITALADLQKRCGVDELKMSKKSLVLFYSRSGNTRRIAQIIAEKTGTDLRELQSEVPYSQDYNLCLDAGYTGSGKAVEQRNYIPHIRPRGEEKKELERNLDFRARRWVVEVTHSFFNRFRKLLVRFQFACAVIVWRKLIPVHR